MFDKCETMAPQEELISLGDIEADDQIEADAWADLQALERQEIDELEVADMQGLGYGDATHGT